MGPLAGLRVIEIAGLGPGPFAAMVLADMGADVLRVDRPGGGFFGAGATTDFLNRGKRSLGLDLKHPDGVATLLQLVEGADALIEGFRPGVVEKLGIGPDVCLARNPRLAYGRMTGWGQEGPLAREAGHDINYIALSGALHAIGRRDEAPAIPLNLIGDFGGGGLLLAFGLVCAMLEARGSGKGQVVDAAMIDGAALLMASIYGAHQTGYWSDERGTHMLDSGAHFYDVYETADGRWISIGSIEPQFYAALLERLGLPPESLPAQMDPQAWPKLKVRFAEIFKTKTRDEWCRIFEGSDACFAPVLGMAEVHDHPHHLARDTFHEIHGARQPRPAPRFSRTPAEVSRPPAAIGAHTDEVLGELGYSAEEVARLRASGGVH